MSRRSILLTVAILSACACLVVVVVVLRTHRGRSLTRVLVAGTDLGRPVSLETGSEAQPAHQGFLDCADKLFKPDFRHSDTQQLATNVNSTQAASTGVVIIGHGAPGLQCTGAGDSCRGSDTDTIGAFNQASWKGLLNRVASNASFVSLVGCDIGQGEDGAEFLFAMAQATHRPVRAPDSIVFCHPDGIELYGNGKWVIATPTHKPVTKTEQRTVPRTSDATFVVDGRQLTVPRTAVAIKEASHRGYRESEFRSLSSRSFLPLLQSLDFSSPIQNRGSPAAILTGRVAIYIAVGSRRIEKRLLLFNDELLQDVDHPEIFYIAGSELHQELTALQ